MKNQILMLAIGALLAPAAVCQALNPANKPIPVDLQQVSLHVTTLNGTVGAFCEPSECFAHQVKTTSGDKVRFDVGAAPGTLFLLFAGVDPTCVRLPDVLGNMNVLPLVTLGVGVIANGPGPVAPCHPSVGTLQWVVPDGAPIGLAVRFQALGFDNLGGGMNLGFAAATDVLIR